MADLDIKQLKGLSEELEKMGNVSTRAADRVGRIRSQMRDLKLAGKEGSEEFVRLGVVLRLASQRSDKLSHSLREMKKARKNISDLFPQSTIKTMKDYNSHLKSMGEAYVRNLDAAKASGDLTEDQYKRMLKDVDKFRDELAKVSSEPIKLVLETESEDVDKAKAARGKLAEGVGGAARGVFSGMSGVTGVSSKTMSGAADAFKNTWESGKTLTSSFKNLKGMMDAAGKGSGMMVGAMSLLGKAFMANPIMMVVAGFQMFMSVVNDLDQMIKGLNKSWKEMAGSPMLLKDIRGSMKAFNDSIYNLDRNMRLGLKASSIQEFFKTMSSAGLSTEGVSKRVGDFNSAIETGYKLSLKFGVSFSEMGQMMSQQMLDLRSSLDDVSSAFKSMSYDAAIAGVQSQKFYQVVENASMSLSFYGNFLDSTSARLRDFVQTGVMGFKDASQVVQDLAGTFKGMGMDQRRALVNIIGEDEVKGMFSERMKEMDTDMRAQLSKVADLRKKPGGEETKEYKAAKMRLEAMKGDLRNLKEATRTGDVTALGSMLEVLSDKVLGAAAKVLERTGVDFFEDKAAAFAVLQNQFGWSIDMVNKSFKKANISMEIMGDTSKRMTAAMGSSSEETKKSFDKIVSDVRAYVKDPASSPYSSFENMVKDIKEKFADMGLGADLGPMLDLLSNSETAFADFIDFTMGKSKKSLSQIATGAAVGTRTRDVADMSENQMDDLIKQTTPIADYLEIGKENIKYALASSNIQNTIALGVTATARSAGGIFKFLSGMWGRGGGIGREKEYKKGEYKVKAMMTRSKMLEKLIEMASELEDTDPQKVGLMETYKKEQEYIAIELEKTGNAFSDVQLELNKTQDAAHNAFGTWAEDMQKTEKVMSEQKNTYNDIAKRIEEGAGVGYATEEERLNLLKNQAEAAGKYNEQVAMLQQLLMAAGGFSQTTSKQGKIGEYQSANVLGGTQLAVPEVKDFLAKSGGMVNVSAGDRIVNEKSLAKGLAMGSGQMMNYGAGIMKGGSGGGGGFSIGNVSLNFNAPVNGDPEEYRRMFVQAVNDVVSKRLYDNKSRVA